MKPRTWSMKCYYMQNITHNNVQASSQILFILVQTAPYFHNNSTCFSHRPPYMSWSYIFKTNFGKFGLTRDPTRSAVRGWTPPVSKSDYGALVASLPQGRRWPHYSAWWSIVSMWLIRHIQTYITPPSRKILHIFRLRIIQSTVTFTSSDPWGHGTWVRWRSRLSITLQSLKFVGFPSRIIYHNFPLYQSGWRPFDYSVTWRGQLLRQFSASCTFFFST